MTDLITRIEGVAGCITLNRPDALNALTYEMCLQIEACLDVWEEDDAVQLIIIDAAGDRAFCSGGDISVMYETAKAGDFEYGRRFWTDEYRLNAKLATCPKPVVTFLHGFTMGGGVGVGCHASHRIVCENSQIAMPECGIGLVPDVGGSLLLARSPGRCGEYLGTTTTRMDAADAIYVGFADTYVPKSDWIALRYNLIRTGDMGCLTAIENDPGPSKLEGVQADIDRYFAGETFTDILNGLKNSDSGFARESLAKLQKPSPLAMAATVEMIHRVRGLDDIVAALDMEYRFTYRSAEEGDFIEGIRALIIDKDKNPNWQLSLDDNLMPAASKMLRPLGKNALNLTGDVAMKVGFIGLGNMGAPMAANLAAAGYDVVGFDTHAAPEGLTLAETAQEAAQNADIVITMLPNGEIAQAVANQVLPEMKEGAVLLDCSTIDVASARAIAQSCKKRGVHALDAPVSGGVGGAAGGTLTFMVGGDIAGFEKAKPLFDVMGQKAVHCGDAGNGQAAKICNNMILGITMIGTCEAFALADKLGLDRQAMFDVVSTSSGYSWTMNAYCPAPGIGPQSPADNGYKPGFAADLMLKDLRLAQQAAADVDADTPMGQAAQDLYRQFVEEEDGAGKDFSAMLPRFEKRGR